jgi:hypothetical protein
MNDASLASACLYPTLHQAVAEYRVECSILLTFGFHWPPFVLRPYFRLPNTVSKIRSIMMVTPGSILSLRMFSSAFLKNNDLGVFGDLLNHDIDLGTEYIRHAYQGEMGRTEQRGILVQCMH